MFILLCLLSCNVTLSIRTNGMYRIDEGIIKSRLMNIHSIGRPKKLFILFHVRNGKANRPSVEINRYALRNHLTHI